MATGDESYLKGDSNREGGMRVLELADTGDSDLPNFALQTLKGGRWRDVEFRNSAGSAIEQVPVTAFGAVGDGETDDTDAIIAAFAAAPTNADIVFPAGKSYVMGLVTLPTLSNVRVLGYGAKLLMRGSGAKFYSPSAKYLIDTTFEGLWAEGEADQTLHQHLYVDYNGAHNGNKNVKFLNNRVQKMETGVRIFDYGKGLWCCNNYMEDFYAIATNPGGEGWAFAFEMGRAFIMNNYCYRTRRHAIYSSILSDDVIVSGNIIHEHRNGDWVPGEAVLAGIEIVNANNKMAIDNLFVDCTDAGIQMGSSLGFACADLIARGNYFKNHYGPALVVGDTNGGLGAKRLLVENNTIVPHASYDAGVSSGGYYDILCYPFTGRISGNVLRSQSAHTYRKKVIGFLTSTGAEDFDVDVSGNDFEMWSAQAGWAIVLEPANTTMITSGAPDKFRWWNNRFRFVGTSIVNYNVYYSTLGNNGITNTLIEDHFGVEKTLTVGGAIAVNGYSRYTYTPAAAVAVTSLTGGYTDAEVEFVCGAGTSGVNTVTLTQGSTIKCQGTTSAVLDTVGDRIKFRRDASGVFWEIARKEF